ncbi:MAG: CHAD domain-containing protein [Chloroflexia bacterium]
MQAERRTFGLTHKDRVVGDVVLDSLMQPTDDGVASGAFGRLEIRLNSGRKGAAVERFVQELCEGTRLSGTTTSVIASVFAWSGLDPEPPDLGSTDVSDDQSLGDFAYAVLRKQFAAFRSHDAGVRLDEDPEEVHDMRVAIRRMRVAMSLFSDALPAESPRSVMS